MGHAIGLGLSLFAFWLLMSGYVLPLLIGLGIASTLLVVWIAHRMDLTDHESFPLHLSLRVPAYWLWLFKEIIVANIDVARMVLAPGLPISPRMIRVPMSQHDDLGRVIYANSITLTPGTVSVEVEENHILVHSLSAAMAEGLAEGGMDRRVTALEGR